MLKPQHDKQNLIHTCRYTHKVNGTLCATIEEIQMMIEVLQLLADNLDMQHIQNGAQQCHLGKLAYMFV